MTWVALHRLHHAVADTAADVHSPACGFWHAHTGWLLGKFGRHPLPCALFALSGFGLQAVLLWRDIQRLFGHRTPVWRQHCRDLAREPLMLFLDRPLILSSLFALQATTAWALGDAMGVVWLWSLHVVQNNASWVVNSFCHTAKFGGRDHDTPDRSRNVSWLAWLTFGDAFHNNHHRHPTSARHGSIGQRDVTWSLICAMQRLGWVTEVRLSVVNRADQRR